MMPVDLARLAGFDPSDTINLRLLKADVTANQDAVMDAFYRHVLDFPAFREMIERACTRSKISLDQLVAHMNEMQFRHWDRLFDGVPCDDLKATARQIGIAHEECLLTSDLYVASSAFILEKILGLAVDHCLGDSERAAPLKAMLAAVVHMLFLDLAQTISAYDNAAALTSFRRVSEPLFKAFEQEVTSDLESMAGSAEEINIIIKSIVDLNNDNMRRCQDTVSSIGELAANLGELGIITQHIENFVRVINDVARKTKLLALNAAIEAARSGEYGRGFNVVASEVKALAGEAEEATRKVTLQAAEIRSVITSALSQVDGSQRLVQAIDQGVATESKAIAQQCVAVSEISNNLTSVSDNARGLRERFKMLEVS
ncbi:MAG: globin-coupled sensor protein [Xanthobacteraceae bacterium]